MNYQPLFNKLADLGYIETESDMQEIIRVVLRMTGHDKLVSTTRIFLKKYHRYETSATQGRMKERDIARKELEAELEKWPIEMGREKVRGLF